MIAFKDLCIDAVDVPASSRFWAAAIGLRPATDATPAKLTGERPEHTIWVNAVADPPTVKQRVHLDLHVREVDDVVALGALVADESQAWTVLSDPEGGELCAFRREPDQLPDYRLYEVCVDAVDHARIAAWWAAAFGGVAVEHGDDDSFCWIEHAPGLPWPLVFNSVPEPKTVKNRIHWDVWGDADELVATGARVLRRRGDDIDWDVLADPEGNEFCVFTPTD